MNEKADYWLKKEFSRFELVWLEVACLIVGAFAMWAYYNFPF